MEIKKNTGRLTTRCAIHFQNEVRVVTLSVKRLTHKQFMPVPNTDNTAGNKTIAVKTAKNTAVKPPMATENRILIGKINKPLKLAKTATPLKKTA